MRWWLPALLLPIGCIRIQWVVDPVEPIDTTAGILGAALEVYDHVHQEHKAEKEKVDIEMQQRCESCGGTLKDGVCSCVAPDAGSG